MLESENVKYIQIKPIHYTKHSMFCFYTYKRTLQILKEKEDSLQHPIKGVQLVPTGGERLFEVDMIERDFYLKTKFTNTNNTVDILFHIVIHLYSTLHYINLPEGSIIPSYEKIISDFFLESYLDSKYEAFENVGKEFHGDDFQDIFEKYHFSSFPKRTESIHSFFESLNNQELIRVMKLVSWLVSPQDNVTFNHVGTFPEEDPTKIFTIDRLIEMNNTIIDYMEDTQNEVLTPQKKVLLNACFQYYLTHKMEDRLIGMLEFFSEDIFVITDTTIRTIVYSDMYHLLYKFVSERIFTLYDFEKVIEDGRYMVLLYSLTDIMEEHVDDPNRIYVERMISNIQFFNILINRTSEELIHYIASNPDFKFKIPKEYIHYLIRKPNTLYYMLKKNRISKRKILFQTIIELTDFDLYKDLLPLIPFDFLCSFTFESYTENQIMGSREILQLHPQITGNKLFDASLKREYRLNFIKMHIPSSFSLFTQSHILDYLTNY